MNTRMRPWSVLAILVFALGLTTTAAADPPEWQPMLGKSFKGDMKDLGVTGLLVYRDPGCVFLQVEDKGVFCSPAGANSFRLVTETWKEVSDHAQKKSRPNHLFVLTESGIKESTNGGVTWSKPIPLPKGFVPTTEAWVQHDATNDVLYLMKKGSDLYKLTRRK